MTWSSFSRVTLFLEEPAQIEAQAGCSSRDSNEQPALISMKTYKNLFTQIMSFENILLASYKAARGKNEQPNIMRYFSNLEENVCQLRYELSRQTYRPGKYDTFEIYHPKPRMISAAPFRDRVVHHALINIAGPLAERLLIYDCYANRVGKGTHRAIRRYQQFMREYEYVLKCDIRKYFPSIDHEILKAMFRRLIADQKTLWLIDTIIDRSNKQVFVRDYFAGDDLFSPVRRRKGLPIGNLTSQIFANFYLSPFDHIVKETIGCRGYLRYVDDFALFSNSKRQLREWHEQISLHLAQHRLRLNPKRTHLTPCSTAHRFLGQIILRSHRRLPGENVRRFKKRLRRWEKAPPQNLQERIASWFGHAKQADTAALLKSFGHPMIGKLLV
jgi:retron-type reverse transcriptase